MKTGIIENVSGCILMYPEMNEAATGATRAERVVVLCCALASDSNMNKQPRYVAQRNKSGILISIISRALGARR